MNVETVAMKIRYFLLLAMATSILATSALAWNCPPYPYTTENWLWCHDVVVDPNYAEAENIGVAENQSTSLGSPAIVYVARPTSLTPPYDFSVMTQIGGVTAEVEDYTNTTTEFFGLMATPSLSVLPNGEAYVAWPEIRVTSTSSHVTIRCYSLDSSGNWQTETPLYYSTNLHAFDFEIGGFDVQIYDLNHYAFGGSWWTQANSTADYVYNYRLKMNDGHGPKDILYKQGTFDHEEDTPSISGPLPFSYKMGTSAASPSSIVYNAAASYDSTTGSPIGQQLTVFYLSSSSPYGKVTEAVIRNTAVNYFTLVTTNANNRYVVYQHISSPSSNYMYSATSSSLGSWSTHQPVTSGAYNYEEVLGQPIAAAADPSENSDAFDVYCWTPESYDPDISWVLRHSTGTSYVADYVVYDTFGGLNRPTPKSIGTVGTGENVVHVSTFAYGNELAVN